MPGVKQFIVGVFLIIFTLTECREMCYTCSYTINSLKQGLECVDSPKNVTIGQWASQCPYQCLITSQITMETMEIRSFNRMCGFEQGENRCEEHGPYEICYHTCGEDFCNDGVMGLLKGVIDDEENGGMTPSLYSGTILLLASLLVLL